MPLVVKDRVRETTTTTGTGTITLAGAVAGFQSFSAIGNGNTTYYTINLPGANEWEVGIGTYTASGTTLSRDTILASSNGGSAVNFSAGTKDVFCTYPAGKSAYLDAANNLLIGTTTNTNTSNIVANGTISETVSGTQYLVASQYDVGTNPNQIPLNQYLGDMAFQSSAGVSVGILAATTIDTTNLEVTNIKAKDGTAAITLADSTGVATFSANPILNASTANGVPYLNASKVLTTGSALTFNGTVLAVSTLDTRLTLTSTGSGQTVGISIKGGAGSGDAFNFLESLNNDGTQAWYVGGNGVANTLAFKTNGNNERARITSTGTLNIVGAGTAGTNQAISFNGSTPVDTLVTTSGGNVGIGTDAPPRPLTVQGITTVASNNGQLRLRDTTTTTKSLDFGMAGDTSQGFIQAQNVGIAYLDLILQGNGGNVGIGTSSPGYKLDVQIDNSTAYNPVSGSVAVLRIGNNYGSAGNTQALITHYCSNYSSVWNTGLVETSGGAYTGAYIIQNRTGASTYAERLRLDTSGNLGLGVPPSASAAPTIEVGNAGNCITSRGAIDFRILSGAFQDGASSWKYAQSGQPVGMLQMVNGSFGFNNAPSGTAGNAVSFTTAMTLDASGNLVLGNTSVTSGMRLDVQGGDFRVGDDANQGFEAGYSAGGSQAFIQGYNRGTSAFIDLAVTGSNIKFLSGSSATERARITSGGSLQLGSATNAGARAFIYDDRSNSANADEAALCVREDGTNAIQTWLGSGGAERARITSGGGFLVGRQAAIGSELLCVEGSNADFLSRIRNTSATTPSGLFVSYTAAAPNGTGSLFLRCDDSAATRAEIRSNGGLANYQSNNVDLSDARTKTDINPLGSYWSKIAGLEIVTYKYKDQTHDDLNIGVIAQQVEAVAPEFVDSDGFGETPEDGVPLKTIYNKDLTFAAIKALQEAMARIETLEAKIAVLESKGV